MSLSVSSLPSPALHFASVAFYGRSFAEYRHLFHLELADLDRIRILDVGAGPSSFAAEASCGGLDVTAVDPLYGQPLDALRQHIRLDDDRMSEQVRRNAALFRPVRFASIEAAQAERQMAADRFLADYEFGFIHGRYVGAALPRLNFPDGHFDLVLCAHLLFLYAQLFDFEWHVAACAELIRVCRGSVKIHPVCGRDGQPYAQLSELIARLELREVSAALSASGPPMFGASDHGQVLTLTRKSSGGGTEVFSPTKSGR